MVGGGDTAMEVALVLTRFATKVYLLHLRESFRASKVMLERATANPKIEFLTNTVVEEVLGVEEKSVCGLHIRNVKTGEKSTLPVTGFFLGIGHEPNAKMFHGQIDLDAEGYIRATKRPLWCKPRSRAFLPAATCRTGATGRRLPRLGRGAWRRLRRRSSSKSTGIDLRVVPPTLATDTKASRGWGTHICSPTLVRRTHKDGAPLIRCYCLGAVPEFAGESRAG